MCQQMSADHLSLSTGVKKSGLLYIYVIFLKLVESYSEDSLLTALDNVFARRNFPGKIVTDAGNNFVKARRMLLAPDKQFGGFSEDGISLIQHK